MNTEITPIRNEISSLVLVALRLLCSRFFAEWQMTLIEAFAASRPDIHARMVAEIARDVAYQSRRRDAFGKASQPLSQPSNLLKGVRAQPQSGVIFSRRDCKLCIVWDGVRFGPTNLSAS
jgi:hypothetical protein